MCLSPTRYDLTHWERETHIYASPYWTVISSGNGLSSVRCRANIWTDAWMALILFLGTNFTEFSMEIHIFSFKKMHLKMSSGKCRPFCLGLNVLSPQQCETSCMSSSVIHLFDKCWRPHIVDKYYAHSNTMVTAIQFAIAAIFTMNWARKLHNWDSAISVTNEIYGNQKYGLIHAMWLRYGDVLCNVMLHDMMYISSF